MLESLVHQLTNPRNELIVICYRDRSMRTVIASFVITLTAAAVVSAATITPQEAASHIGERATVEGTASVYIARSGVIFVDLGGSGRSAPFTGVIFKDRASLFAGIDSVSCKTVDLIGTIKEYHGKPEIIWDRPGQLSS
jgi:hypothetical protein